MNRILITYGGREYSIGNRSRDDVEAEIARNLDSGRTEWLDVNWGAGTPRPCRLLLTPGVPISIVEFERSDPDEADPPAGA